jgi:DNA-binding SARP family transcriptional activator
MDLRRDTPGPSFETDSLHISVQLFGSLLVRRGTIVLDARQLGGPKPRQVLEILSLHLGTAVSKDRLVSLLWNDDPPVEAVPTLESYVSVLRRNIQPGAGKSGPLQTVNGGYLLDRTRVEVDLDEFDILLQRATRAPAPESLGLLRQALRLSAAPILGDELYAVWADEERMLCTARVVSALIVAAETAALMHESAEAVLWANRALALDPLNERAWLALILGLEQAGRLAEGLRAYERCRRALDRELGCTPSDDLRALQSRLLHATAVGDDELSDVLAAFFVLHDRLRQASAPSMGTATLAVPSLVREASDVISSFLSRAVVTP